MAEARERGELVLSPNSYVYVLDETKGLVSCLVGPYKMSLANSDCPVIFNERSNKFDRMDCDLDSAIQTFVTAPENWYVVLKNPTADGAHPVPGTSNILPDLVVGKKINIQGPVSFALYPGQMAKVVRGHRMHSNQYLKARVYNANEANKTIVGHPNPETGNETDAIVPPVQPKGYVDGQIIIIKGTEQPFYIPPTGIEVLPVGGRGDEYVRNAITLENLEYCVKKKESGEKLYIHGPSVVFPEPDEVFIENENNGGYKFRAYELTDTSGIYVKVLMDYEDETLKKSYRAGDEIFITGLDQRIYYPRKEHAIISYGDRVMNYAVAIPKGEGRYVLDRNFGDIDMVVGPKMFLPNPIDSVIVRRRLTKRQCDLWFPGSQKALEANGYRASDADDNICENVNMMSMKKSFSGGDTFSRGTTYTEPRTIELDNKYRGVVTIDVWTGYAVNIVGKDGNRRIVVGPTSTMLAYDETLESLKVSTGQPKTTDKLVEFVYLKTLNNKISDIVHIQTSDFVDMFIKVSYCVDFVPEYKDRWFNVENYVKYLTDRIRSILRGVAKKFTAEEFYQRTTEIIRGVILGEGTLRFAEEETATEDNALEVLDVVADDAEDVEEGTTNTESVEVELDPHADDLDDLMDLMMEGMEEQTGMLFEENGMVIHDVEILSVIIAETSIGARFRQYQDFVLQKGLELSKEKRDKDYTMEKIALDTEKDTATHGYAVLREKRRSEYELLEKRNVALVDDFDLEREQKVLEARERCLKLEEAIATSELERASKEEENRLKVLSCETELATDKLESYGDMICDILSGLSPEFAAAMNNRANAEMMKSIMESMSPYAISDGESVVDTVTKLTRGSVLEQSLGQILKMFKEEPKETPEIVEEHKEDM